jgi:hypothetical protein
MDLIQVFVQQPLKVERVTGLLQLHFTKELFPDVCDTSRKFRHCHSRHHGQFVRGLLAGSSPYNSKAERQIYRLATFRKVARGSKNLIKSCIYRSDKAKHYFRISNEVRCVGRQVGLHKSKSHKGAYERRAEWSFHWLA